MAGEVNRQVRLKARPDGIPQATHFEIVESAVPAIGEGQVLVRNRFLSVDPAMRGWVSTMASYSPPVGIGEVMRSFAAGEVVASRHQDYAVGDSVMGMLGWQDYAVSDGRSITRKVRETDLPLSLSLGVLGLNGVTAYFGLLHDRPTETGRHRPRLDRRRRRRLLRRPDCQAGRLPHGRHRRRPGEDAPLPQRVRLRRRNRL